jgi:hypothetical protein
MDVDLLPNPLPVNGVILADMLVGQRGAVLYQIALDDGVVTERPPDGIQPDVGIRDDHRGLRRILRGNGCGGCALILLGPFLLGAGFSDGPLGRLLFRRRRLRVHHSCHKGEDQGQQAESDKMLFHASCIL